MGAKFWRFREGLPELMRVGISIMKFIRQKKEGGKSKGERVRGFQTNTVIGY